MKEGLIRGTTRAVILAGALSACTPSSTSEHINDLDTKVGQIDIRLDSMKQSIDALGTTTIPATTIPETTTSTSTTTTTEAPQPELNLYALFAQDIVTGIPELNVDQVEAELRYLDSTLPENLPFVSQEANEGLIFHPATGGVIEELPKVYRNASEGGGAYISAGQMTIRFDEKEFNYPYKEYNVYQIYVAGKPDDTTGRDLNTTLELDDYKAGHVYTNQYNPRQGEVFENRRFINRAKFVQDLWYGIVSGSNCGVGCEATVTLPFIDTYTGNENVWEVNISPEGTGFPEITWNQIVPTPTS